MSPSLLLTTALSYITLAAASFHLHPRQSTPSSNVTITTLSQTGNTTTGTAQVAASGSLHGFGAIGVGCGVNWEENTSFGGGLQAGSPNFGLGGGYTIKPHSMEIGAGFGYTQLNASASVTFSGKDDGTFEFEFESSRAFVCVPGEMKEGGKQSVKCGTVGGK